MIICPICTECVLPTEDLCANSCGHIFHYPCIRQWIERSKSCPQCRKICSEKELIRIYITVSSEESTDEDVAILERKNELLNQNYQEKIKAHDELLAEVKNLQGDKKKSVKTILALEDKLNSKDFALKSSTNELKKIKEELLDYRECKKELDTIKSQLDKVQAIEILLTSNQAEVQELLGRNPTFETLALMITNLKRDLVKSESAKKDLRSILTKTKNSLKEEQQRREKLQDRVNMLESQNFELQRQVRKRSRDDEGDDEGSSEKRRISDGSSTSLPSPNSSLQKDSDSPYLKIQSSSVGLTPILKKSTLMTSSKPANPVNNLHPDLQKLTIFQTYRPEPKDNKKLHGTYICDGLGGLEKKENFPDFPSPAKKADNLNSTSIKSRLKKGILKNPMKK
ncbi:E3 ubiquitin-protein ligase TRAIP [Sergentomyia squamirostris]